MTDEQSYLAGCEQAKADWQDDAIGVDEEMQTDEFVRGYTNTVKALSIEAPED